MIGSVCAPIAFPCTVHIQTRPLRTGRTFLGTLPKSRNNSHLCPSSLVSRSLPTECRNRQRISSSGIYFAVRKMLEDDGVVK